ncbi:hypothetical protein LBMAG42_23850 [Deltaproteobacteria bacterium]|nr:hypothetical protein LBMAG42_23850 [Deltaproteobacteria bacterium]
MHALYLAILGCSNPEAVDEGDVTAKVILPKAAVTRTVVRAEEEDLDGDGEGDGTYAYTYEEVTDPRLIGPVYVGAFSAIDELSFPFTHPAMGPQINEGSYGDTYPYGGATVGRLDFACYEALACKVTTGRFSDYDSLLDHFKNNIGVPVVDGNGEEVLNGETMRERCYDYFYATSDEEMAFIGEERLAFSEEGDNYVADVVLHHTNRIDGMVLWGFMDAPELRTTAAEVALNGAFTTCDPNGGNIVEKYNEAFVEGRAQYDILNSPSTYVQPGDWVADGKAVVHFDSELNQTGDVELNLNFDYEGE